MTRTFSQTLDPKSFRSFEECWKIILRHIYFASVHEFQNGLQMVEWYIFQNDDGMLRRVILKITIAMINYY